MKNLDIQQFNVNDPICESINDLLLKTSVKYQNNPSIIAIKEKCNSKSLFMLTSVENKDIKQPKHE